MDRRRTARWREIQGIPCCRIRSRLFNNADDQSALLNNGSYLAIPLEIRSRVNTLFEFFVLDHITRKVGCAFETTLGSGITFEQARLAKQAGFEIEMRYVALTNFDLHFQRFKERAFSGGHGAPASVLKSIYESSLANLPRAILEMDFISVYDNSRWGLAPSLLLQAERGELLYLAEEIPDWLDRTLSRL